MCFLEVFSVYPSVVLQVLLVHPLQTKKTEALTLIRLLVGYLLAYLSYLPSIHHFRNIRRKHPGRLTPEARLWWLLFRK